MTLSFCHQPPSISHMSSGHRWFIYLSGLIETALWSGTIFGWASLVHVLKTQGVYSNLCEDDNGTNETVNSNLCDNSSLPMNCSSYLPDSSPEVISECQEQDRQFVLVGAVAIGIYALPGILIGYSIHHIGLAFNRIVASLMISMGFLLLSMTTEENPDYLWGSTILLSLGGNIVRMSCLEFGNLFPRHRNTLMAIISGIYTLSAAIFLLVQLALEAGYLWGNICKSLAAASLLIVVFTPLMPWHHIPRVETEEASEFSPLLDSEGKGSAKIKETPSEPLGRSLFSYSWCLVLLWLLITLFATTVFTTFFNPWINRFSQNQEEVAYYSRQYGYANLSCFCGAPLAGLLIDAIATRLKKGKTGVAEKVAVVQAMIVPLIIVTITIAMQISCFFFFAPWAVYLGLFLLIINRPSCQGISLPFVRARFPADHFNRLVGIQGTMLCILMTTIQYPYFAWTLSQYRLAYGTLVGLLLLVLVHPLHLLSTKYLHRVLSSSQTSID